MTTDQPPRAFVLLWRSLCKESRAIIYADAGPQYRALLDKLSEEFPA